MKRLLALTLVFVITLTVVGPVSSATQMQLVAEINGWTAISMSLALGRWKVTVLSSANDSSSEFLFCEEAGCSTKWSRGDGVTLNQKTTWFANGANGRFNATSGKYYTFTAKNVNAGANSEGFVFETDNAPVTIASVTQHPGRATNCIFNEEVTVTVTLSGAKSGQEKVYVRYTNNNWSNSYVVEVTTFDANHQGTAAIPAQSAGTTVAYYVLTTATTVSNNDGDADLKTINFDNNNGANYTYTVADSSVFNYTTGAGNWSATTNWNGGALPGATAAVIVRHNVTLDQDATIRSIKICPGAAFNGGDAKTLALEGSNAAPPIFANDGAFEPGTGTVHFKGQSNASVKNNGRVWGPNATTFNNVTLSYNGSGTTEDDVFGVDFFDQDTPAVRATINGVLLLNTRTFVAHAETGRNGASGTDGAPFYGSNSKLLYNNTGTFDSAEEWKTGACGAAGVPQNVEIANNTTVNIAAAHTYSANSNKTACGTITINSGSTLQSTAGTLTAKGNWTNNGTFTHNNGTVTFNGTAAQTIGGDVASNFYNLTLNNSAGANLGRAQSVANQLTLTSGRLTLGGHNLTLGGSALPVAGTFSANRMIVADGTGALCKAYSATGSFLFPIGDVSGLDDIADYSPATLNFTSGTFDPGQACVRVTDAKHPNNNSPSHFLTRYWTVAATGISNFSAESTFTYVDADIEGTETLISALKWANDSWTTGNAVDAANNRFSMTMHAFSDFTGGNTPTAVTLARFEALWQGDAVRVTWETAMELDNLGFNLYRGASPAGPWTRLNAELIPAQHPGAVFGALYEWLDADVTPGAPAYYRLEDVDIHGASTFHGPIQAAPTEPSAVTLIAFGACNPVFGLTLVFPLGWAVWRRRRAR